MPEAIATQGLTRQFGGGHGVFDLDLSVPAGMVYGFLGPNGAGKTTTIRLLLGLLKPERGSLQVFGETLAPKQRNALARIGSLVESPALYPHLTGRQNLEVTRRLLAIDRGRIDEVLEITGMRDAADRRVREYSLGMKQRLAISLALLNAPRLLILDEPANGLDPSGILDMRRLLRRLAQDGITVFVSSHQLSEVEQFATHVGVLHAGRLRFQGTLDSLRARHAAHLHLRCDDALRAAQLLMSVGETVGDAGLDTLSVKLRQRSAGQINKLLVEAGITVSHLAREQMSLEDLFFDMTRIDTTRAEAAA